MQEIRARNYERVELLFQRCLIRVLSIELWKTYLLYVKVNQLHVCVCIPLLEHLTDALSKGDQGLSDHIQGEDGPGV